MTRGRGKRVHSDDKLALATSIKKRSAPAPPNAPLGAALRNAFLI